MDHLTSSQERKNRWYARHVNPVYKSIHNVNVNVNVTHAHIHGDNNDSEKAINIQIQPSSVSASVSVSVSVPGIPSSLLHIPSVAQQMKDILAKNGFVVVRNTMTQTQCQDAISLAWDFIEAASCAEQYLQRQPLQRQQLQRQQLQRQQDQNQDQQSKGKKQKNTNESSSIPNKTKTTGTTMHYKDNDNIIDTDAPNHHHHHHHHHHHPTTTGNVLPPVQRHDPSTYSSPYYPRSLEGRIFPFYGSGHSKFMWYIRSIPQVQNVFASLYSVSVHDLRTSLDGFLFWHDRPKQNPNPNQNQNQKQNAIDKDEEDGDNHEWDLDKGWFHIDQNPETKPDFASYQGLVNLLPTTPYTGGNVVISKSHLLFPHHYLSNGGDDGGGDDDDDDGGGDDDDAKLFYKERLKEINGDDWLEIDKNDTKLFPPSNKVSESNKSQDNIIMCLLQAGDLLLWDSRTVHCSYPGKKTRISSSNKQKQKQKQKEGQLDRVAALVNMMPSSSLTPNSNLSIERRNAVDALRTLTHWVNKCAPLGEERTEEVKKEEICVNYLKELSKRMNTAPVLLAWDDLNLHQRRMI